MTFCWIRSNISRKICWLLIIPISKFYSLFRSELLCSKRSSIFWYSFLNCRFDFAANYKILQYVDVRKVSFHYFFYFRATMQWLEEKDIKLFREVVGEGILKHKSGNCEGGNACGMLLLPSLFLNVLWKQAELWKKNLM